MFILGLYLILKQSYFVCCKWFLSSTCYHHDCYYDECCHKYSDCCSDIADIGCYSDWLDKSIPHAIHQ